MPADEPASSHNDRDGSAPPSASAGASNQGPPAEPDTAQKITRISAAAKTALHKYFMENNYKRNDKMPKRNGDKGLDAIINKFSLERSQASRQLRNWKGINFDNSQVKLVIHPEDIEECIYQGLSEDSLESFIDKILKNICDGSEVDGSVDATNFCRSIRKRNPGQLAAVECIVNDPTHECRSILVSFFKRLTDLAGELFPRSASSLPAKELLFNVRIRWLKGDLMKPWKQQYPGIMLPPDTSLNEEALATLAFFFSTASFLFGPGCWLMRSVLRPRSLRNAWLVNILVRLFIMLRDGRSNVHPWH